MASGKSIHTLNNQYGSDVPVSKGFNTRVLRASVLDFHTECLPCFAWSAAHRFCESWPDWWTERGDRPRSTFFTPTLPLLRGLKSWPIQKCLWILMWYFWVSPTHVVPLLRTMWDQPHTLRFLNTLWRPAGKYVDCSATHVNSILL